MALLESEEALDITPAGPVVLRGATSAHQGQFSERLGMFLIMTMIIRELPAFSRQESEMLNILPCKKQLDNSDESFYTLHHLHRSLWTFMCMQYLFTVT